MKYSVIGIIIWISAAIYWFFQKIASVVPQIDLDIFTIQAIFGLDWLAIGLVFIIIGMFFKT